jgi:replicative DNA helicase
MSGTKKVNYPWKGQRQGYLDALKYMTGRMEGRISSFKTPWSKVNDAGVDGFEWHSMIVIGGRPGTGKTLIKDQIIREAFVLNKGSNMRVLEFQFEMLARVSAIREFSSVLGQSYKYVCSAGGTKVTTTDINKCHEYAKGRVENPVDIIETPCTVEEYKKHIHNYMKAHSTLVQVPIKDKNGNPTGETKPVRQYMNTVITVDHSYLFKKGAKEGNKTDMLYNLGEACTELKRIYPILFIILSQLKREADKPDRNEDGKYGNYILDSDILGGDALMQHADLVFGLNRPGTKFIKFYGPDRFIIEDDTVLVFHFLKVRNGDTRMSFFKAVFEKMSIVEIATPGSQEKRMSTK